eukprot:g15915.t1
MDRSLRKAGSSRKDKLHATFVFCGELLHALPKAELAELHQELGALIQEAEIEELPFNRFELFPPGKQNLVIARFFAPKRLVRLRRQLWRSCLQRKAALKVDDEWLPHVTLGKLQASKAQVGQVDCRRLEALVPQKRLMVEGVTLLGLRPKQLWLDWDEAFRFRAPEKSGEEDKDEDSSKPGSSVSTGAERVWGAGMVMANYLSTWEANGLEVVELGAGCGLPGLVLARNGASVTLTDVPWLLQMLEYNVAANFSRSDPLRPYVAPLRWGNSEDVAQVLQAIGRVPDLVMGADLVYRERDFDALLGCIESLAPKRTLLAVQRRDIALEAFMTRLKHRGWFLSSQNIAPRVFLLDAREEVWTQPSGGELRTAELGKTWPFFK